MTSVSDPRFLDETEPQNQDKRVGRIEDLYNEIKKAQDSTESQLSMLEPDEGGMETQEQIDDLYEKLDERTRGIESMYFSMMAELMREMKELRSELLVYKSMEQFFRYSGIKDETTKVNITSNYVIDVGGDANVPSSRHLGNSEGYFTFIDGLQQWVKFEIQRRGVKELSEAMDVAKSLTSFKVKKANSSKPKPKSKDNDGERRPREDPTTIRKSQEGSWKEGPDFMDIIVAGIGAKMVFVIQFSKGVRKEEPTYLAMLIEDELSMTERVPTEVGQVLMEFRDVIPKELPKYFPPKGEVDHKIELVSNAESPAKTPYLMAPLDKKTLKEHVEHLRKVFQVLRENDFYFKEEKCSFAQKEVPFLCHVVGGGKLRMDGDKVRAIDEWKLPIKMATPLTELLKKNKAWDWCCHIAPSCLLFSPMHPTLPLVGLIQEYGKLRKELMKECHDSKWAVHLGVYQNSILLIEQYYWPHMVEDVQAYVRTCLVCQQDKIEMKIPSRFLQPFPIPERLWESIFVDFIVGFPITNGISSIMVVFDKFLTFILTFKVCLAEEFSYNLQWSEATNQSPFKIMTGQQPLTPNTIATKYEGLSLAAHEFANEWQEHLDFSRACLHKAGKWTKKWTDRKMRDLHFQVGDLVLTKFNGILRNLTVHKGLVQIYEGSWEHVEGLWQFRTKINQFHSKQVTRVSLDLMGENDTDHEAMAEVTTQKRAHGNLGGVLGLASPFRLARFLGMKSHA
ncbi:hypothetical protein F3Y22_tig00000340pilonHSYRG00780 [Hibiscus syriacus]|uniref:Integrase zinc-binding domain-containing protein n=1 Tax=Hibiscus syriacus TaxID=106335 RepID=A0A6A3D4Z7_HIBSY|nr:hypothetical protein F3Y22_tig00000340pilonHSYRG00780 [Hibiscus syriacus]